MQNPLVNILALLVQRIARKTCHVSHSPRVHHRVVLAHLQWAALHHLHWVTLYHLHLHKHQGWAHFTVGTALKVRRRPVLLLALVVHHQNALLGRTASDILRAMTVTVSTVAPVGMTLLHHVRSHVLTLMSVTVEKFALDTRHVIYQRQTFQSNHFIVAQT